MLIKTNFKSFEMILIFDLILFAAAFIPEIPESSDPDLEPLFRLLEGSNSSHQVHAIVHHGRALAELLVRYNITANDSFELENSEKIEDCSLLAM